MSCVALDAHYNLKMSVVGQAEWNMCETVRGASSRAKHFPEGQYSLRVCYLEFFAVIQ